MLFVVFLSEIFEIQSSVMSFLWILCLITMFSAFRSTTLEPYDTDQMAKEFLLQFSGQAFTVGQQLAFNFLDKKLLGLVVKSLEGKYSCGCVCIIPTYCHLKTWNVHPHYLHARSALLWLIIKNSFVSNLFPPPLYVQDFLLFDQPEYSAHIGISS